MTMFVRSCQTPLLLISLSLVGAELHGQDARTLGTVRYVVLNHGRNAGEMVVFRGGDSAVVRFQSQDRNRMAKHITTYRFDSNGFVTALDRRDLLVSTRGNPRQGAERFRRENGLASWVSPVDSGSVRADDAIYETRSPVAYDVALLASSLLRRPDRRAATLPGGTARVALVVDTTLLVNGSQQRLRLAVIENTGAFPPLSAVWLDGGGSLFASQAGWFVTVRAGGESVLPILRAIEFAYVVGRAEAAARRLSTSRPTALVIRNGNVFDSERGMVRPQTTIVLRGDRIVAVGPSDSIVAPRDATVIDATGKTLIPGLWDMHTHPSGGVYSVESSGLLRLAAGITTIRDMASDPEVILLLRDRIRAGTLLSPRILPAGFIDGPGLWVGPSAAIITSEQEGIAWVAKYDSLGYRQIKLYNLVHPYWVRPIADEAHRRGMRVSGHVPVGLSVPAAIGLGFDEINHAGFLLTTFFPDSFHLPTQRAMLAVTSAVAANFDVDSPRLTALIALLRDHGTVIDGTFNLFEDRSVPLPDGTDPVFGPTLSWQPTLMRRARLDAPAQSSQERTLAQKRSATMRHLLKRLFDSGVTIVPGTDNVAGVSYHGELEIYQRAGIPAAAVLAIATINSARVMGEERDYGSIAVGKIADIAIVNGRPDLDIRQLRCTEYVIQAGRMYRTATLYRAAGLTPRACPQPRSRD